jgi:phospholipid/cholesterol/gamma-HCH transport system substrate-binding protein
MQNSLVESLIGAAVIAIAAVFLFFAYTSTGSGSVSGYDVTARFNRVDGVAVGTDVRLSGIKVGSVAGLTLDPKDFSAVARLSIASYVKLPDDSAVKITSEGLLGTSYLSISPGGSNTDIKPGGQITETQGAIDLIGLLSKAVFGAGDSKSDDSKSGDSKSGDSK